MNLAQFLKETDLAAEKLSKEELLFFIHDLARTQNEKDREDFLYRIHTIRQKSGQKKKNSPSREDSNTIRILLDKCEKILDKLNKIECGSLCLKGYLNQEYDDWYDSADDEFLYEDPNGIENIIGQACSLARQCVRFGLYQPVCNMAEILIGLEIEISGEYQEYSEEPMNVDDMGIYDMGHFDYRQFVIDALYAFYQNEKPENRAAILYNVIKNSRQKDITLEMIMQNAAELSDIDEFLPLWIDYLGGKSSDRAQRLLEEAIDLTGDPDQLLKKARQLVEKHPGLYERYIRDHAESMEPLRLMETGNEALDLIDSKYLIRSRIALLLSQTALTAGKTKDAEKYWLEAFRSDTTVENYFRLFMESENFSCYKNDIKQICKKALVQMQENPYAFSPHGELQENIPGKNNAFMIAFLCCEFSYIKNSAMNKMGDLGWSMTFMKCGLSAFLLLLYDSDTLQTGGKELCKKIVAEIGFNKEHYQQFTLRTIPEDNAEWFWTCFSAWKKTAVLFEADRSSYMNWISGLIKQRVIAIMEANKRNYYHECACFIAALGEVQESRGEVGGKQRIMSEFMNMYPRRSAFRAELCSLGMINRRKK